MRKTFLATWLLLPLVATPLKAEPTGQVVGGYTYTTVKLDDSFLLALETLNPAPVSPGLIAAVLDGSGSSSTIATFPVSGGAVQTGTISGAIGHTGGLSLSKDGTTVVLSNFVIDTTDTTNLVLTGLVSVDGGPLNNEIVRAPIFSLSLSANSQAAPAVAGSIFSITNVNVTLTEDAISLLNEAFATGLSSIGVGTANVQALIAPADMSDGSGDDENGS